MKKYCLLFLMLAAKITALACASCTTSLPKGLRGISPHGTGPDSNWDYPIVIACILIVLLTFFYSVKWLIKPGETANTHIKTLILTHE